MKAKVFGNRGLSQKAKMQVYNAMVVPVMTYGCESWVLREKEKSRLQATEMSVLRRIVGVTRWTTLEMRRSGTGYSRGQLWM